MATTYYELLGVALTASPDEIRSAFRREIARYHPDKVQHLGNEFQNIAAIRSAELTQAYKTLTDGALRADYDARARTSVVSQPPPSAPAPVPDSSASFDAESVTSAVRAGVSNFVQRAAVVRVRQALQAEFGFCKEVAVNGFDIVCAPAKPRFWSRLPPRIYARFVRYVDVAAVTETCEMVRRAVARDERGLCVFLIAPNVVPEAELSVAVTRERRKFRSAGLTLTIVPVNTRTWAAQVPNDVPPAIRSMAARLQRS
jgi:hypothetical protein